MIPLYLQRDRGVGVSLAVPAMAQMFDSYRRWLTLMRSVSLCRIFVRCLCGIHEFLCLDWCLCTLCCRVAGVVVVVSSCFLLLLEYSHICSLENLENISPDSHQQLIWKFIMFLNQKMLIERQ